MSRPCLPMLLVAVILSGCASTTQPPQVPFPRPPEGPMQPGQELRPLPKDVQTVQQALPTVTGNYARALENRRRLDLLQRWVREQYKKTNGKPLE